VGKERLRGHSTESGATALKKAAVAKPAAGKRWSHARNERADSTWSGHRQPRGSAGHPYGPALLALRQLDTLRKGASYGQTTKKRCWWI
jgi:hypothetical protein